MFSTDTFFSLHLLADHGYHFTVDTVANIRPLRAVSILSLSSILVLNAFIEAARKGIRTLLQQQSQFCLNLNWVCSRQNFLDNNRHNYITHSINQQREILVKIYSSYNGNWWEKGVGWQQAK